MKDTVAIYSGGMDSFTLVSLLHDEGRLHSCLSFNYGQRHAKELEYAKRWCEANDVPHVIIDLSFIKPLLKGSALTDDVVLSEGHYAQDSMKLTVVPNRNMIMLSIAVAHAIANRCDRVAYGAHAGDHTIYPDCREEFVEALNNAVELCDWHKVVLYVPFQHLDKAGILKVGARLGLDYANSWTCYAGTERACGKCGSCQERLTAFADLGLEDPQSYVTRELLEKGDL